MSFTRRGFRCFLALLLLFSQQQAGLHLLGHGLAQLSASSIAPAAGQGTRPDTTDPQELVCAKCLAVAHLDHALSGSVPALAAVVSAPEWVADPGASSVDLAFVAAYRSRAPPVFS